jgi:hypothetical protein
MGTSLRRARPEWVTGTEPPVTAVTCRAQLRSLPLHLHKLRRGPHVRVEIRHDPEQALKTRLERLGQPLADAAMSGRRCFNSKYRVSGGAIRLWRQ